MIDESVCQELCKNCCESCKESAIRECLELVRSGEDRCTMLCAGCCSEGCKKQCIDVCENLPGRELDDVA